MWRDKKIVSGKDFAPCVTEKKKLFLANNLYQHQKLGGKETIKTQTDQHFLSASIYIYTYTSIEEQVSGTVARVTTATEAKLRGSGARL